MIGKIVTAATQNGFQNLIQNTTAQVAIETSLKAVGRPLFTLADGHVDKETRKYSASKELLYQILCLGIYLAIIPVAFTKFGFNIMKKVCNKANAHPELLEQLTRTSANNNTGIKNCSIDMIKNHKALVSLYKLAKMTPAERFEKGNRNAEKLLQNLKNGLDSSPAAKEILEKIETAPKDDEFFRRFLVAKGGLEMSNLAGSVIGLTVLAPELSHLVLHPIMKAIGLEKPKETSEVAAQKIDKNA